MNQSKGSVLKMAALIHNLQGDDIEKNTEIKKGIRFVKIFENDKVYRLYEKLCFETKIDNGDPYDYNFYLLFEDKYVGNELFYDTPNDPYPLISRVCNILSIVLSEPIGTCRIILTIDGFENCFYTNEIYQYFDITMDLVKDKKTIDKKFLDTFIKAYLNSKNFWNGEKLGRIANSLIYFFYAWRSPHYEQMCINLAIVLETLFAPMSNTEIGHQIAYNLCKFVTQEAENRKNIFRMIKKFYTIRSKIIHGSEPDFIVLSEIVPQVFRLCANILKKLLLNLEISRVFNNNKERNQLFEKFLFE